MKIIHFKFLDPVVYTNKFFTEKEISKLESRNIEAVGYKIHEDDFNFYFVNNTNGKDFKRVLCVNKNAVIESEEAFPTTGGTVGEIVELKYADTHQSQNGVVVTQSSLQNEPKPPSIQICGFLVFEDEKCIAVAVEKSQDKKYRTITVIPKKLVDLSATQDPSTT